MFLFPPFISSLFFFTILILFCVEEGEIEQKRNEKKNVKHIGSFDVGLIAQFSALLDDKGKIYCYRNFSIYLAISRIYTQFVRWFTVIPMNWYFANQIFFYFKYYGISAQFEEKNVLPQKKTLFQSILR